MKQNIKYYTFRFIVYGIILTFGEIVFYNMTKLGRMLPDWSSWFFSYNWRVDDSLQLFQVWETPMIALYGQASLWMFLVYGSIAITIDYTYRKLKDKNFAQFRLVSIYTDLPDPKTKKGKVYTVSNNNNKNSILHKINLVIRGLIYMSIILALECIWGWIFHYGVGYDIWYYADGNFTIFRYTSWKIAPMWFAVGLLSENLIKIIDYFTNNKYRNVG